MISHVINHMTRDSRDGPVVALGEFQEGTQVDPSVVTMAVLHTHTHTHTGGDQRVNVK